MKAHNHAKNPEDTAALYADEVRHDLYPSSFILQPFEEAFDRTVRAAPRRRARQIKTLGAWLRDYLEYLRHERRLTPQACAASQRHLQQYIDWLRAHHIEAPRAVTAAVVTRYAHDLRAGQLRPARLARLYTPGTVAVKLSTLRDFHQYLARVAKCPNPAEHLEAEVGMASTIASAARAHDMAPEQVAALLRALNPHTALGMRDRAIIELLCAGLDASQIAALRPADYDSQTHRVTVRQGQDQHSVPLSEMAHLSLNNYVKHARPRLVANQEKRAQKRRRAAVLSPGGNPAGRRPGHTALLFFNTHGGPFSPALLHAMVRRHADAARLPVWITPHTLQQVRRPAAPGSSRAATNRLRRTFFKAHPRA